MATALERMIAHLLEHGPCSAKRLGEDLGIKGGTARPTLRAAADDPESPVSNEHGVYTLAWHPETREPLKARLVTPVQERVLEAMEPK